VKLKGLSLPPWARTLHYLAVSLAVSLAFLFAVDLFVYFVLDHKVPGHDPSRFISFDTDLGHFHRPNASGYWYRYNDGSKYFVEINEFGFSDRSRSLEKQKARVALIGDSTTQGWEAPPGDRSQLAIEKLLGGQYEVLNFGVRAYGTDQTYLLFKKLGVLFSPDIVIYTFCINDIHDNLVTDGKPYFVLDPDAENHLRLEGYPVRMSPPREKSFKKRLRPYSFIYRKLALARRKITLWLYPESKEIMPLEEMFELSPFKRIYGPEEEEGMEITLRLISRLDSFCRERGIKFLLVEGVYKPALDSSMKKTIIGRYGDRFDFNKVSEILERHCAERGIAFLSLPERIMARKMDVREIMHREENIHLDRRGIQVFSDEVIGKLHELGWVAEGDAAGLTSNRPGVE